MIPNQIIQILQTLERAGYQAWLVGGCVRDGLMGRAPNDWDICTDALPDQVKTLFPDCLDFGVQHGTVTVRWEGVSAEVTTFRAEGQYSDHRRPDHVTFIKDLHEDLARRDFTVNAIAMDARGELRDPFGGVRDLQLGILRAVGEPKTRFQEDALRMLRALRFSAQLGFSVEHATMYAIADCAELTARLAAERVCMELEKTIMTNHPEQAERMCSLGLLIPWGIHRHINPLASLRDLPQSRQVRWMGYGLTLPDTAPLAALRLDRKTIAACEAAKSLGAAQSRDELYWKKAISRYDPELVRLCALTLSPADFHTVDSILSRGDCCRLEDLAISGRDALAAGLRDREIHDALQAALRHVWLHPEDNASDRLAQFLKKEAKRHDE